MVMTPYQYLKFAQHWNTQRLSRNLQLATKDIPTNPFGNKDLLTLHDILIWWYGDIPLYHIFHTTDRAVVESLSTNLQKQSGARDLRGTGLLGNGFYVTPNARLAFLYGIKSMTPRVFRDQWAFVVFRCALSRDAAKTLRYGIDFYFHDESTMKRIGAPLNANDLMGREIVLKTQTALTSIRLVKTMIVAGSPYGHSARDNVWNSYSHIFRTHQRPLPLPRHLRSLPLYDAFLKNLPMEAIPGFGIVYSVHRYARFILFEGTIHHFLHHLRQTPTFVSTFQRIIQSLGTTVRIHFNRFTATNQNQMGARCFIVEGHIVHYDPHKFFQEPSRRAKTHPFALLSTSKGMHVPLLILPPFSPDPKYANIYTFAVHASLTEFMAFFAYAATVVDHILSAAYENIPHCDPIDMNLIEGFCQREQMSTKGLFMNFHGGSVGWLHLRLDLYPAYYALDEWILLEHLTTPSMTIMTYYGQEAIKKVAAQRQQREARKKKIRDLFPPR